MIVIKAGGGEGIHYESVCDEVAQLYGDKQQVILVHGGSHLTNQLADALKRPPKFVTSPTGFTSRFTDRPAMEIFMMAYCGQNNKTIVEGLQQRGVNAVGLCGMDAKIWVGKQKSAIPVMENGKKRILRGNLTGIVEKVNCEFLNQLLDGGMLPVLCPPAITDDGIAINVDGDRASAITAAKMKADDLVILSNVPGVMKDVNASDSRIDSITRHDLDDISNQFAEGRMKIKLLAAGHAIDGGVQRVIISDARPDRCITRALNGEGTTITA